MIIIIILTGIKNWCYSSIQTMRLGWNNGVDLLYKLVFCADTGATFPGRGYLGDMCSSTRSVATATAAGLSAGLTAAHETGHKYVCDEVRHKIW